MEDQEPTIRGRELGEGLARALKNAKLKQTDASRKLGWSQGRVSRLLSGKRGGSEVDVSAFLAIVEVTGAERERLLGICREQSTPGWLQQHGTRLPQQLRTLIDHEDKAVTHSHVQPMLVPGLLQTAEYARAVISRVPNVPAEEVDDRVAARLSRQSLFTREQPARFTFYIHEAALRLPVGGPVVMAEQLRHLLLKVTRPYLKLRVIPVSHGAYAATAGPFIFMEFATFRPVVYLESATASVFLEKPEQITAYRSILRALAKTALSEEESRELIATLATEFAADREDHHDRA